MTKLALHPSSTPQSPCAACKVAYGASCCEVKEGDGPRFPMTYWEANRLARWTGREFSKAVEVREVSSAEQGALEAYAPRLSELIVDGRGLYLPLVGKACTYLGPQGCTVPHAKPLMCAMFPFAKVGKTWRIGKLVDGSGFCYGQDQAAGSTLKALGLFDESFSHLDDLDQRWRRGISDHKRQMRKWSQRNGERARQEGKGTGKGR